MSKKAKPLPFIVVAIVAGLIGYGACHGLHELERQQIAAEEKAKQQELYEAKVASLEAAMHGVTRYLNSLPTGRVME